jgi:hypothetical protein
MAVVAGRQVKEEPVYLELELWEKALGLWATALETHATF